MLSRYKARLRRTDEEAKSPHYESKLINLEEKVVHPHDIRDALIKEKRKKFAKKWFTKFNMYKRNYENIEMQKKNRASSGIGDERIRQMENQHSGGVSKVRNNRRGGFRRHEDGRGKAHYSSGKKKVDFEA